MSLLRLLSVLHSAEANPADGAKYGYDAAGNRKSKQNLGSGVSESYGYDDIYQLTQVTQTVNGADSTSEKYSYDAVGNRLSALGLSPWTFNSSNQLLSTPGSSSLYDNNGNLTSKTQGSVTTEYSWDVENRLTQVTKADGTGVTFKYDPFGRRIQKASAGTAINYVYDGANMVAEYDTAGTVLAKYAQGSGIDEPLAIQRGGTTGFYHADGLGSITSLTATGGTTLNTYAYDSFGNTTASEAIGNPFRYTGREWDQETGLYYYRARYYSPDIGRFISEDPIGFKSGDTSFYVYVSNGAPNFYDPSGLKEDSPANRARRAAIAAEANNAKGSHNWDVDSSLGSQYPRNSYKCSKFVCDIIAKAGAPIHVTVNGKPRCATAGELANRKWNPKDWRILNLGEVRLPGDVASYPLEHNPDNPLQYSGHSGVVVDGGVMAAHEDGPISARSGQFTPDEPVVYRRYTGE